MQKQTFQSDIKQENNQLPIVTSFQELKLELNLLRGIYAYGFESPSLIQQKAILPILKGLDVIGQAQSGTGKTGAFCIGALQKIDCQSPHCQALILCHTRQLAMQIKNVIKNLSQFLGVKVLTCIGGTDIKATRQAIKEGGNQIIVGTPGRVKDMIQKNILKVDHLRLCVLDQADQMLSLGFLEEIKQIFSHLPSDTQVCLFSATFTQQVLDLTNCFMKNPIKILLNDNQVKLDGINQFYIAMKEDQQKFGTLIQLYKNLTITQCIIFTNKKQRVDWLSSKLKQLKFVVSSLHGDLEMSERVQVMKQFKTGASRVLIATDLIGRGIDIQHVNLVINYDLPNQIPSYIHRIGRTGRFGKKGAAINFLTPGDSQFVSRLKQKHGIIMNELPMDTSKIYE